MGEPGHSDSVLYHKKVEGAGFGVFHLMTVLLGIGLVASTVYLPFDLEMVVFFGSSFLGALFFSVLLVLQSKHGRSLTVTDNAITINRFGRDRVIPLERVTAIERDEVPGFTVRFRGKILGFAIVESPLCTPELDPVFVELGSKHGFDVHLSP